MSDAPDTDATLRALARLRADQDEAHRAAQAAGDDPRFAPPDEAEQADFLAALLGAPAAAEPTPTTAAARCSALVPTPSRMPRPAPSASGSSCSNDASCTWCGATVRGSAHAPSVRPR